MAGPDLERLAVWRSFLAANAVIDRALTIALDEERDMPLPWFEVLNALQAEGGRLRMMDLAERVHASPSSLSRQLNRMQDEGYVRRDRDKRDDLRVVLVVLTRDGREIWRRANTTYLRIVKRRFTSHLTESDVTYLNRVLGKVLEGG